MDRIKRYADLGASVVLVLTAIVGGISRVPG